MSQIIDEATVIGRLKRMLKGGKLTNIPRRKTDRDVLLALAAARFDPEIAYTESDVNIVLDGWLKSFCHSRHIDYVTIRRYLVDFGYLRRDPSGRLYRLYGARLDGDISESARRIEPGKILEDLELERGFRKNIHRAN